MAIPVWHTEDQQVNAQFSTGEVSVARPTNLAADDLWWVTIGTRARTSDTNTPATPSGWSMPVAAGTFGAYPGSFSYYKVVTNPGSEPATIEFPFDGDWEHWRALSGRISGADTTAPISGTPTVRQNESNDVIMLNSLTTQHDECLLIAHYVVRSESASTEITELPAGMTAVDTFIGTGGSANGRYATLTENRPTQGSTGSRTATVNVTRRVAGHMIAIAPAEDDPQPPEEVNPGSFYRYLREGNWSR